MDRKGGLDEKDVWMRECVDGSRGVMTRFRRCEHEKR